MMGNVVPQHAIPRLTRPTPRYIVRLRLPTIQAGEIAGEPSYDYRLIHVIGRHDISGLACYTPATARHAGPLKGADP